MNGATKPFAGISGAYEGHDQILSVSDFSDPQEAALTVRTYHARCAHNTEKILQDTGYPNAERTNHINPQ
jgi:hypothetical protein